MDIKTILITGASKGIGASFSKFLASEGYRIIGIARNKDQLIKTFNSLPNQNLNHDILPIDITDFNLVKEKLSHINLYCLINNAGIAQSNLLHEASLDEINQIMNINLISALNISNTIIPKMILNKKAAATPTAIIFLLFCGAKPDAIIPIMIALSAAITISISII